MRRRTEFNQNLSKTLAEMRRFYRFFKWRPSAILDLLGAYWDQPR